MFKDFSAFFSLGKNQLNQKQKRKEIKLSCSLLMRSVEILM